MAKKFDHVCVLYEVGDCVIAKHDPTAEPKTILHVELKKFNNQYKTPYQLIWFDSVDTFPAVASHYEPFGDTIEKYKDGLNVYNRKMVKESKTKIVSTSTRKTSKVSGDELKKEIENAPVFKITFKPKL